VQNWCRGKAIRIKLSKCVFVALFIWRAKCIRHIILSSAVCSAVSYIPTLSHKLHDFLKKKVIKPKLCVLIFSTNFSTKFHILKII